MNNNNNEDNNSNNKRSISFITDPILTKLLMEGFWDKTLTKTKTTPTTTKQKQQQQQIYLSYHRPNFD